MKKTKNFLKKAFLLLALIGGASSAWGESITVTWLPNNMSSKTQSGTASTEGVLTVNDFTTSSPITLGDPSTYDSKKWGNFTSTTRPGKNKIAPADYITFTVTVKDGYTFTPTSATAYWVGIGTGNNAAGLYTAIQGSEVSSAADNSSSAASTTQKSLALSGSYSSGQNVTFYIHIGQNNTTETKGVAIRDVVLSGTYEASDAPNTAPSFTTNLPTTDNANVGIEKSLSVEVSGKPAPTYQWYSCDDTEKKNAEAIDGATTSTYAFTPAAAGTFYYYVVATNSEGSATSNVVSVTVVAAPPANPTFKVYGNTVQLESATDGATIFYELGNPDVKSSPTKSTYSGAFIPASSGTIYTYAEKSGLQSEVVSQAVTLSTVGDVVGGKLVSMQPAEEESGEYSDKTYSNNGFTLVSTAKLEASGRGVYTYHFKTSGTITVTAPSSMIIQSIKIIGTSNDGSKVSTITAGDGATVISTPAELMQRDVTVGGVQTMTEIVVTTDEPSAGNSVSFTLGRESRFYVEVYGAVSKTISDAGWATYCSPYALDFSSAIANLADAYIVIGGAAGVLTKVSVKGGTVPANTGLLLKGEGECVIPVVASSSTDVSDNKLEGVTEATVIAAEAGYVLMGTPSLGFYKNANAFTLGANTAYLPVGFTGSTPDAAPSAFRIVDEVNGATDIQNIEANEKAIKFIENGRILILRDGITYDALGRKVR